MSYLKRIYSGGQTGADQAGLFVAHYLGIETSGWMPKGWITLTGPRPDLAERYNLKEHNSSKYPPRTYQNVKDADATIRFFIKEHSAGEVCTLKAIKQYNKLYFDVDFNNPPNPEKLSEFLWENKIISLNVAGNAEKTSPGIYELTAKYLFKSLKLYLDKYANLSRIRNF